MNLSTVKQHIKFAVKNLTNLLAQKGHPLLGFVKNSSFQKRNVQNRNQ
jgi:hypothetical protein